MLNKLFACRPPQLVTSEVSCTPSSVLTAEGVLSGTRPSVCLYVHPHLSLFPKRSGSARTNLSGRWGTGFLHVT